jgi:K+-sensing histidine kinase KdpD
MKFSEPANAIKFSFGKNVTLKLCGENDIYIEIIDEGPGFTAKDKEKYFRNLPGLAPSLQGRTFNRAGFR